MKKTSLLLLISFLLNTVVFSQSKKELKAEQSAKEYEVMNTLIDSQNFEFEADWATSQQGRRVNLNSSSNFLRIKNDSAEIYLPYFGTLSSGAAAMNNEGGINFAGIMEDYEMSVNEKKQQISVQFNATTKNDRFQFRMTIYKGGNTLVNLSSNYRSVIKYDGNTRKIQKKK